MSDTNENNAKKGLGLMHAGMAVCCAVMLIPVAGFFIAGGTLAGLTNNLAVFAPIALCVGVHVAMFAFMGKSCHGNKKTKQTAEQDALFESSQIPAVVRSK